MVVLGRVKWKGGVVRADALWVFQPQLRTRCSQLLFQEGEDELVTLGTEVGGSNMSWTLQDGCGFSHEIWLFIYLRKSQ